MALNKRLIAIKSAVNLSLKTLKHFRLVCIITQLNASVCAHFIHHLIHVDESWSHFRILLRRCFIICSYVIHLILTT